MIYILNKQEEIVDIIEPKKERSYHNDLHVQDLREGSETLEFDTEVNIPENATLVLRTLSGDLHPFIVQKVRQYSSDTFEKTYYCDAEFLELRYTRILEQQKLDGQTAQTALQFALQGTRWQMGIVDAGTVKDIEITEYMNVLKFVRMLATEFDLEMRFRTEFSANSISARYVDLVERTGIDMGKEIVFGKDLESIERIEDTSAVVTALYGVGPADDNGVVMTIASANGGKVYVEDTAALQRWSKDGEHRYDVFTPSVDTDGITPEILLDMTRKELARRVNSVVSYKVEAIDMYDIFGYEHERVYLGDTARIKDTKWENAPLYLEARVLKIERSYTDPSRNTFELGDYREIEIRTYQYIRQIQTLLNGSKESWNKAEENAVSRAQLIIDETASSWSATVASMSEDLNGQISSINTQLSVMDGKIASKVEQSVYNGETIVSLIEQTAAEIKISASKIDLVGAVTVLSDITGNLGTITAGVITGTTIESSATGKSVVIKSDELTSYANRGGTGSPTWGTAHLAISSGQLSIGLSGSLDNIKLTAGAITFGNGGTVTTNGELDFVGTVDFSDATVKGITASYATTAGSANYVAGSNVDGYVANASYASRAGTVGSQALVLSVLSNGSLQITTSSGKTATYLMDGWTG